MRITHWMIVACFVAIITYCWIGFQHSRNIDPIPNQSHVNV